MSVSIRSRYQLVSFPGTFFEPGSSSSHQSFKDECDVNVILSKYMRTGVLPSGVNRPSYTDLPPVESYHEALNLFLDAQSSFDLLPSDTRRFFGNDPENLLKFVHDPANADKLVELGLADPKPAPQEPSPGQIDIAQPKKASASKSVDKAPPVEG